MGNRSYCKSTISLEDRQAYQHIKVYLKPFSRPTCSSELECHGSWGLVCWTHGTHALQYYDTKKYDTSSM